MTLVSKRDLLSGNEIKFIRTILDLSQSELGRILGLNYQTVLAWEKNKDSITKTADHLLRVIFFSYLDTKNSKTIYDKINEIADFDPEETKNKKPDKLEFKEVAHEWRMVA